MNSFAYQLCLGFGFIFCTSLCAQQVPDPDVSIQLERPRYELNKGPVVAIDAGHNNLHTLDGGFAPFAKLLTADGYPTQSIGTFSEKTLAGTKILVIANALDASNLGNWRLPTPTAFTTEEIDQLEQWVKAGGRLLLIADHMPFGGAANALAKRFGFAYENGFVMSQKQVWPPETYSKVNGTLLDNDLTRNVDTLAGFTGSALKAPADASPIALFPDSHQLLLPEVAWQFDSNTTTKPVSDFVMGAVKNYGEGKIGVFTEAAMFTAQIVQNKYKVGFTSPTAKDNQQFILNVLHWLDDDPGSGSAAIVKKLLAEQEKAFEENRLQDVAGFYCEDGIIYEPTGQEIVGSKQINNYWKQLQGKAISWDTEIQTVEQLGEQILAICLFDLRFIHTNNQAITASSKAMITFKKEGKQYKIYRDFYFPIKR